MSNWKTITMLILSFATGILVGYLLVGYFLLGNSAVSGFAQWIGTTLTLGWFLDLMVSALREARQEKQAAHAKAIEQLIKHTENLKPILRKIIENPQYPSNEPMFLQTEKHIETGYPELWSLPRR